MMAGLAVRCTRCQICAEKLAVIESQPYPVDTAHGLARRCVPRKDGFICVTAIAASLRSSQ